MAETSTIFGFMKYVSATDILSDFKKTVDSHFVNSLNRATLIARFFLFLTHKALTQVLGLNSKRYVLHRTQSKHASACEQSLNKSYHSFAAI